jgi:hypothetical protein
MLYRNKQARLIPSRSRGCKQWLTPFLLEHDLDPKNGEPFFGIILYPLAPIGDLSTVCVL